MTAPDFTRGYLRVPHSVWRAVFCRAPLTRRQLQIVAVVIRESWGWQKRGGEVYLWTRPLSPRQLAQATGLSTDHLARDLRNLLDHGVLRETEGRYQFVPEPALWITTGRRTSTERSAPPPLPARTAETAPTEPGLKTAEKRQRHVGPPPKAGLSPGGENSPATCPLPAPEASSAPVLSTPETRFYEVVASFVGELSPEQSANLRHWIADDGVSAVWAVLGPVFARGPKAVRRLVKARDRNRPAPRRRLRTQPSREGPDAGTASR